MNDGPTELADVSNTEANREFVRSFVRDVLIDGRVERLDDYIDPHVYTEHSPSLSDDVAGLRRALVAALATPGLPHVGVDGGCVDVASLDQLQGSAMAPDLPHFGEELGGSPGASQVVNRSGGPSVVAINAPYLPFFQGSR